MAIQLDEEVVILERLSSFICADVNDDDDGCATAV